MQVVEEKKLESLGFTISLIVKAESELDAKSIIASRLNRWFIESKGLPPYPRETLLYWCFLEEGKE